MPRTPAADVACMLACMFVSLAADPRGVFAAGQSSPGRDSTTGPDTVTTSLTLRDSSRGRDVVLRVTRPEVLPADARLPIVVFSHPPGGRPADHDRLLRAWASRGVLCLAPVHPDSPEFVPPAWWPRPRPADADDRARDLMFALAAAPEIERRLPALKDRLSPDRVALAAQGTATLTALLTAGLRPDASTREPTRPDRRLRALILVHPFLPERPTFSDREFARLGLPILVVAHTPGATETNGPTTTPTGLPGRPPLADPLAPFRLSPAGDKFLVLLREPNQAPGAAESLTATFLDAYLRDDTAARDLLLAGSAIAPFAGNATLENR